MLTWSERRRMKRELRLLDKKMDAAQIFDAAQHYYTDREYIACVSDILENPVFRSMGNYIMHGNTTCRTHCIDVSYFSYNVAKKLGLNAEACARAGLLHDMFLYDWHDHIRTTGNHFHGLTHPRVAMNNASKNFCLSCMERDIILKHMWPLTVVPPKYKEGLVVCYADKYCCVAEVLRRLSHRFRRALSA